MSERSILTVRQFVQKHKAFSEAGVRYLIFHAHSNGFESVIRRCGKKILLDEGSFFTWLDQQNNQLHGGAK